MKIEGPGSLRPGQVRKAQKSGSGGDFRSHIEAEEDGGASRAGGAQSMFGVTPLFALQEVDDALQGRKKARARAEDILDRLDEIRLGLLSGTIPQERLVELVRIIQARREQVEDPRLQEILDEIDLRAQVEIAKLTR
ncbi:flagellar assembly protein FliX [Indioceanicola profundi]|uniref:flagellar assembly protein FliX n=1 Tax=Indioceanicola profundi TaxID=2220096 RepID=UPI000E6AA90E|nr:flagellar assembly protein FliX [Indioceanicola profundi]